MPSEVDMTNVPLSSHEVLTETGLIRLLKPGHGILAGMYRHPTYISGGLFYRLRRRGKIKYRPIQALVDKHLGKGKLVIDARWFLLSLRAIRAHNDALRVHYNNAKKRNYYEDFTPPPGWEHGLDLLVIKD